MRGVLLSGALPRRRESSVVLGVCCWVQSVNPATSPGTMSMMTSCTIRAPWRTPRRRPTSRNPALRYAATARSLLSLIHISEPTRLGISYAVFCLKKKKKNKKQRISYITQNQKQKQIKKQKKHKN